MSNRPKLESVFREVFELDANAEVTELSYRLVKNWDSIGHMRLVAAIEASFDLMLSTDDVLALNSFHAAVEILDRNNVSMGT